MLYNAEFVAHAQRLLSSYQQLIGKPLIKRGGSPEEEAKRLYEADFVVVSHNRLQDPVLTYGNQTALKLWEMEWDEFIQTPSRYTAEPENRSTRQELLDQVTRFGFIDNYSGVRISKTGARFRIDEAIVWNLIDESKEVCGQAACFKKWQFLP